MQTRSGHVEPLPIDFRLRSRRDGHRQIVFVFDHRVEYWSIAEADPLCGAFLGTSELGAIVPDDLTRRAWALVPFARPADVAANHPAGRLELALHDRERAWTGELIWGPSAYADPARAPVIEFEDLDRLEALCRDLEVLARKPASISSGVWCGNRRYRPPRLPPPGPITSRSAATVVDMLFYAPPQELTTLEAAIGPIGFPRGTEDGFGSIRRSAPTPGMATCVQALTAEYPYSHHQAPHRPDDGRSQAQRDVELLEVSMQLEVSVTELARIVSDLSPIAIPRPGLLGPPARLSAGDAGYWLVEGTRLTWTSDRPRSGRPLDEQGGRDGFLRSLVEHLRNDASHDGLLRFASRIAASSGELGIRCSPEPAACRFVFDPPIGSEELCDAVAAHFVASAEGSSWVLHPFGSRARAGIPIGAWRLELHLDAAPPSAEMSGSPQVLPFGTRVALLRVSPAPPPGFLRRVLTRWTRGT